MRRPGCHSRHPSNLAEIGATHGEAGLNLVKLETPKGGQFQPRPMATWPGLFPRHCGATARLGGLVKSSHQPSFLQSRWRPAVHDRRAWRSAVRLLQPASTPRGGRPLSFPCFLRI